MIFRKIFSFYYTGFRSMTVGKNLWVIILLKLFVLFAILRLFFFHDFLNSKFTSEEDKSNYVIEQLTK